MIHKVSVLSPAAKIQSFGTLALPEQLAILSAFVCNQTDDDKRDDREASKHPETDW